MTLAMPVKLACALKPVLSLASHLPAFKTLRATHRNADGPSRPREWCAAASLVNATPCRDALRRPQFKPSSNCSKEQNR